jgi:hypothetical protein
MVYAHDPEALPDSEFVPGELAHAVAGNRGRLLDQRRTPIAITAVDPARGQFEQGEPALIELVRAYLAGRGLSDIDERLAATLVSNPRSGETVKAHALVLAALGLGAYEGPTLRDPEVIAGPDAESLRAEHLLVRLGLSQALWSRLGHEQLRLYRGAAVDGPWPTRTPTSFVSATFSRAVAESHFEGGGTAVLWRQEVRIERVLMTFLETAALNRRFREAEVILLGAPDNRAF